MGGRERPLLLLGRKKRKTQLLLHAHIDQQRHTLHQPRAISIPINISFYLPVNSETSRSLTGTNKERLRC